MLYTNEYTNKKAVTSELHYNYDVCVSQVFLSLVYTKASLSTIAPRLKSNGDARLDVTASYLPSSKAAPLLRRGQRDTPLERIGNYVEELCMSMAPVDFVLNTRLIGAVLHILLHDVRQTTRPQNVNQSQASTSGRIPETAKTRMPLLYAKFGEIRLFAPSSKKC